MLANPRALFIVLVITLLASGLTTYFYVTRGVWTLPKPPPRPRAAPRPNTS